MPFPVARYRFEWRVTAPLRLPDYAGSMLRGAFGHALRQLSCMTRQKECDGCPLLSTCPYPAIYSPPPPAQHDLQKFSAIPVPYVIEPPEMGSRRLETGESLSFGMVLLGKALRELPLVILAWRRALARGVGAGDGTADLVRVTVVHASQEWEVHRPESGTIASHSQEVTLNATGNRRGPSSITLHFTTPLRLQQNGRALPPGKLELRTLLMALVRRANLLAEFHCDGPMIEDFGPLSAAADHVRDVQRLKWHDWTRYSSRQQQKMALGGVVGEWTLHGPLGLFWRFVQLGEWLHVGKEASFGLGRYRIGAVEWNITPAAAKEVSTGTDTAMN